MSESEQHEQIGKAYARVKESRQLVACYRSKVSVMKRELSDVAARFDDLAKNAREPIPYPNAR